MGCIVLIRSCTHRYGLRNGKDDVNLNAERIDEGLRGKVGKCIASLNTQRLLGVICRLIQDTKVG